MGGKKTNAHGGPSKLKLQLWFVSTVSLTFSSFYYIFSLSYVPLCSLKLNFYKPSKFIWSFWSYYTNCSFLKSKSYFWRLPSSSHQYVLSVFSTIWFDYFENNSSLPLKSFCLHASSDSYHPISLTYMWNLIATATTKK